MKKILIIAIVSLFVLSCKSDKKYVQRDMFMENTIKNGEGLVVEGQKNYFQNDIVLFEIFDETAGKKQQFSGRIIGQPGDEVVIKNAVVFVDNKIFSLPTTVKYHYSIWLKYIDEEIKRDLDVQGQDLKGYYDCFISQQDSSRLFEKYKIDFFKKTFLAGFNQEALLNGKNKFGWTQDDFGPIKVPKKGDMLTINYAANFLNDYKPVGIDSGKYSNPKHYFFVLCDNFHNGVDSRDFGLISDSQIVGKIVK